MPIIKITSKYQLTIPKEFRDKFKKGQKLQMFEVGDKIILIPIMDIRKFRGFLRGMDIKIKNRFKGLPFKLFL